MLLDSIINEQTPVALGAIALLVGGGAAATGWIIKTFKGMREEFLGLRQEVELLRQDLDNRTDKAMTREDFLRAMLTIKNHNPNFVLPEDLVSRG